MGYLGNVFGAVLVASALLVEFSNGAAGKEGNNAITSAPINQSLSAVVMENMDNIVATPFPATPFPGPEQVYQTTPTPQVPTQATSSFMQNLESFVDNLIPEIPDLSQQVITPTPQVSASLIPQLDFGANVDSVCEITSPRSVLYSPTLQNLEQNTASYKVLQPDWRVDIDKLFVDGVFGEGNYNIWARVNVEGTTNNELDNGWFFVRNSKEIYALCGEWLLKGEDLQARVNQQMQSDAGLGAFQHFGNGTYSINFKSQEEALLWTYILSEGNYDPSLELLPQPYQEQQYDLLDAALLNVLQNDMKIHGDTVKQRLASGRYYGVIHGNPFSNLYNQALRHPNNVTVSSASISPERAERVRAVIALSQRVIPEGYIYIINPPYDSVNMITTLGIDRASLIGPIGIQFFGRN